MNRSANAPCEMSIRLLHVPTHPYHSTNPKHPQFQVFVGIIARDLIVFRIALVRDARYLGHKGMDQTRDFEGYLRMGSSVVRLSTRRSLRKS